jgi:ATP-dependent DNA helicase RecQ
MLGWQRPPESRQGELHNNDQRRDNVSGKMGLGERAALPSGGLLLLDDYVGSGATLKDAARVLRQDAKYRGPIVPLTIARVKWQLGAPGMVPSYRLAAAR